MFLFGKVRKFWNGNAVAKREWLSAQTGAVQDGGGCVFATKRVKEGTTLSIMHWFKNGEKSQIPRKKIEKNDITMQKYT